MNSDKKAIEELKEILRKIEFIEYEDPDEGLIIFCPLCGGQPEPEKLTFGQKNHMSYPVRGTGHDSGCALSLAINGPK